MATVHPFRALRPRRQYLEEVVGTVPHNVVSVEDAREIVERHPQSFLQVIKPEVALSEGSRENLYEAASRHFNRLIDEGYLVVEDEPAIYIYQLDDGNTTATGVFGCVAVGEYDDGTIVRHEKTRTSKAKIRMEYVLALKAHPEPVMLTYQPDQRISNLIREAVSSTDSFIDFVDDQDVRHSLRKLPDPTSFIEAFGGVAQLYVADGHHRCKAASEAARQMVHRDDVSSEIQFFPAVLFAMDQLTIKPYNRVVYRLPMSEFDFLSTLEELSVLERNVDYSVPQKKGELCLYIGGQWHRFKLPQATRSSVASDLDVAKLSDHILRPIIGVKDSRTDKNLDFISGKDGTKPLQELVDRGRADVAFSLYPTSTEELVHVADAGELMPPKSTWFEPKLKSGLLIHSFRKELNSVSKAVNSVERNEI